MPEMQESLLEQTKEEKLRQQKREASIRYYHRHRDLIREQKKLHSDPEKKQLYNQSYRSANLDKLQEYDRCRAKEPERRNKMYMYAHKHRLLNPGERNTYHREYQRKRKMNDETFRERLLQYGRQARAANPEYFRRANKLSRDRIRQSVFDAYGKKCACPPCGETIREFLTIDHINGGGTKHRKETGGGGSTFYFWLRKNNFPSGFQTLCWNCNTAKHFYGSCPHNSQS